LVHAETDTPHEPITDRHSNKCWVQLPENVNVNIYTQSSDTQLFLCTDVHSICVCCVPHGTRFPI
jgi:hypothetical protein